MSGKRQDLTLECCFLKSRDIVMKRILIAGVIVALQFHASALMAKNLAVSSRLVLAQGNVLNAFYDGKYREILRAEVIYGHGWLDDHRVFIAYQKGNGEAVAEIEVFDLRKFKATKLTSLGGVGESNFDINSSTGEAVFSDFEGVKLLKIDVEASTYQIKNIKKDTRCYGTFWIDHNVVGCLVPQGEKFEFINFPVMRQGVSRSRPN